MIGIFACVSLGIVGVEHIVKWWRHYRDIVRRIPVRIQFAPELVNDRIKLPDIDAACPLVGWEQVAHCVSLEQSPRAILISASTGSFPALTTASIICCMLCLNEPG